MASALERFQTACEQRGFRPDVTVYPEGTRTAAAAADAVGCELGQIVKSLIFLGDGAPVLALTSGANRVDTQALAVALGVERVGPADADAAREATGYSIGGTPPFGHVQQLPTVIDRDLLQFDIVWAAGGTPETCFALTPDQLVMHSGGKVADFRVAPAGAERR